MFLPVFGPFIFFPATNLIFGTYNRVETVMVANVKSKPKENRSSDRRERAPTPRSLCAGREKSAVSRAY